MTDFRLVLSTLVVTMAAILQSPTPAVRSPAFAAPSASEAVPRRTPSRSVPRGADVLRVGSYVRLRRAGTGFVRYVGAVDEKEGVWYGIELDEPRGTHDGCPFRRLGDARHQFADTRCGRRYFRCRHRHGLLVRRAAIVDVLPGGSWVASPRVTHRFRAAAQAGVPCASNAAGPAGRMLPSATTLSRMRHTAVRASPGAAATALGQSSRDECAPSPTSNPHESSNVPRGLSRGGGAQAAAAVSAAMSPARAETLRRGMHQLAAARRALDAASDASTGAVDRAAEIAQRARLLITRSRHPAQAGGGVMAALETLETEVALRRRMCAAKEEEQQQQRRGSPRKTPSSSRCIPLAAATPRTADAASAAAPDQQVDSWCSRALDSVRMLEMRRNFDVCSLEINDAHLRNGSALMQHEPDSAQRRDEVEEQAAALVVTRFVRLAGVLRKTGGRPANAAVGAFLSEQAKGRAGNRRRSFSKDARSFRPSVHEGATLIEGFAKKRSTGFRKTWQTRYFAVEGHYLKYYLDARKKEVKGAADLAELRTCLRADETLAAGASSKALREVHVAFASLSDDGTDGLTIVLRLPTVNVVVEWTEVFAQFVDADAQRAAEAAQRARAGVVAAPTHTVTFSIELARDPERGLGLVLDEDEDDETGEVPVSVLEVLEDTPAASARNAEGQQIEENDVIVQIDGATVHGVVFADMMGMMAGKDVVTLTFKRDDRQHEQSKVPERVPDTQSEPGGEASGEASGEVSGTAGSEMAKVPATPAPVPLPPNPVTSTPPAPSAPCTLPVMPALSAPRNLEPEHAMERGAAAQAAPTVVGRRGRREEAKLALASRAERWKQLAGS